MTSQRRASGGDTFQHEFAALKTTKKLPKLAILSSFAKGKFAGIQIEDEVKQQKPNNGGVHATAASAQNSGKVEGASTAASPAPAANDSKEKKAELNTPAPSSDISSLDAIEAEIANLAEQREAERRAQLEKELQEKLAMVSRLSVLPTANAESKAFHDMILSSMSGFKRLKQQQARETAHQQKKREQQEQRNERANAKHTGQGGYKHKIKEQKARVRKMIDW